MNTFNFSGVLILNEIMKILKLTKRRIKNKLGILKQKDVQEYWKNPEDKGNQTESYVQENFLPQKLLISTFLEIARKHNSIIELGCNCGRNLNHLYEEGYVNLSGIEICPMAISQMKKTYPQLYKNSDIQQNSLEESLPDILSNLYDIVFTSAVLMHIPYQSDFIFKEIARICNKYLVIAEGEEMKQCWSHYPRDYKKIFEGFGLKQIKEVRLKDYTLRVFKK